MNWPRLLIRLALILVTAVGGALLGMFLGGMYYRLAQDSLSPWDSLGLVIGGLFIGAFIGLLGGIVAAISLKEERRARTALAILLFDLAFIAILAVTDVID